MLAGNLKSVVGAVVIGVGIGITLGISVIGAATTLTEVTLVKVAGFVVTPPHAAAAVTIEFILKPANRVKP
jgi:hypothetical protein